MKKKKEQDKLRRNRGKGRMRTKKKKINSVVFTEKSRKVRIEKLVLDLSITKLLIILTSTFFKELWR